MKHFGWGFIGAPIAVAVTDNLLPICLVLYVRFIDGGACWGGLTSRAFQNWGPMIRLALPGLLMVEAEFLAFEILTLAASYFGPAHLAAQSVLATITSITFQIPFPISIAASTRIANLIGATLVGPAKTSAKVALVAASMVGIFNVILLSSLRNVIAKLFTNDEEVIALVGRVLPLCAAFQLFDALAANCNGILRGLGRQEIGGYTNLFCYYVVSSFSIAKQVPFTNLNRLPCQYLSAPALDFIGSFWGSGQGQRWPSDLSLPLRRSSYSVQTGIRSLRQHLRGMKLRESACSGCLMFCPYDKRCCYIWIYSLKAQHMNLIPTKHYYVRIKSIITFRRG